MNLFQDYFLAAAGDDRDMTSLIEQKLNTFGICILGAGDFYTTGIRMPQHSQLMGLGDCSRLFLKEEIEEGHALRLGSFCTVKGLWLIGNKTDLGRPSSVGTRHGIGFLGTATTQDWSGQDRNCILESLRITSFTGGGIHCHDTGYSTSCCMVASDIHITSCGVGIFISRYSEYHRFTNIHCTGNHYGCVNNGGNNVFSACSFDSNVVGFLMDNSQGQSPNNSHGSVVGCTFNHTDSNKGVGIMALNTRCGFVFSACQIFYSDIVLENTLNFQFVNFNGGKDVHITAKGASCTAFSECFFDNHPIFDIKECDLFFVRECYTKKGDKILCPNEK